MDLLDKIQATEFLGAEFLVFLWFASEVSESELPLGEQTVGLWLDDQLLLSLPAAPTEKATLRGIAPSGTPEAKEALRQGKLPERAHVGVRIGEREWGMTIDAATMGLSGVKLPQLLDNADGEELFYERMMLLDQLDEVMGALFERFVRLRLSRTWKPTLLPMMRAWVAEDADFDVADAKRRVARALKA